MLTIQRIELAGYRSIGELSLTLRPLNVLIGPNGAGKSNLLSFFRLLNYAMSGGLQVFVGEKGGASKLLHHGPKHTAQITAQLDFASDAGVNSYLALWVPAAGDRLLFANEEIRFQPPDRQPYAHSLSGGHRETLLGESSREGNKTAKFIKGALERFRFYHFHDTSASANIKQTGPINDNRHLRSDGGNLAAFLLMLRERHPQHYEKIRRTICLVAPFFDDFVLEPSALRPDQLLLEWRELGSDTYFNASDLSDGTLRFMCLATLLLQPELPSAIVIDEPELGLHPAAIGQLGGLLRSASRAAQVIVSTQSDRLLDQIEDPEDVIVVERDATNRSATAEPGQSTFRHLCRADLATWLRDYSLGELWLKNVVGGRP